MARRTLIGSLMVATCLAGSARAQGDHVVHGVVFDSIAGAVLPGAIVQAVKLDSASHPTTRGWYGVADRNGHFSIAGIPAGRFAFGFQHDALAALGLDSPLRIVELSSANDVTVDLAIP